MATFELTGPDGEKYHLEAPDENAALSAFATLHGGGSIAAPESPAILSDVAKSGGIGLVKGGIGLAGMGGDVRDLLASGAGKVAGMFGANPENAKAMTGQVLRAAPIIGPALSGPGSADIQKGVEGVTGEFYKPQTTAGEYMQTLGEFAPAALAGPGGIARRVATQVVAPALASETAGQITKGKEAESYARVGGALLGGPAAIMAGRGARALTNPALGTTPGNVARVAGIDVPLSGGQATQNTTQQIMEQAALRGARGDPAQQVAERFFNQEQGPAVADARERIGRAFDPLRQQVVESPVEAGVMAGQGARDVERASRTHYGDLYDTAMALPGEIHAAAFEGLGQRIKGSLTLDRNPVIIDDVTTPVASRAIQDIDNTISRLRIQNRADPFGQPNPETITGVNLAGFDQARKRLISFAQSAERGSADRRAVGRVISAFDDHVENAIANGMFTGDDRALQALRDARQAYREHSQMFRSQGAGDDVGHAMERIIGRNGNGATANETANYLYGESKVGGKGVSTRLAQRMRDVLGPQSEEWAGIRQGLWQRLTQATEGATPFEAQKQASRIAEFINGSGASTAHVMFSPQERQMMAEYAALQRQLIPRPGAVNHSNSGVLLSALKGSANSIMVALGAGLGGPLGAVLGHTVGPIGTRLKENMAARGMRRSLYAPAMLAPTMPRPSTVPAALFNAAQARPPAEAQ